MRASFEVQNWRGSTATVAIATSLLCSTCGGQSELPTHDSSRGGGNAASGGKTSTSGGEDSGGAELTAFGGTGTSSTWVTSTGGNTAAVDCNKVLCGALPTTCKSIVQKPDACCPVCLDSGCDPCVDITCPSGTHVETPVGACCPECVVDKPSACEQGRIDYASFRTSLIEKYGYSGCKNSSECIIVRENNQCVAGCGIPLPTAMSASAQSNLDSMASSYCSTCSPPDPVLCEVMAPACVNGKCVAVNPS
jgi:hypothetical protein